MDVVKEAKHPKYGGILCIALYVIPKTTVLVAILLTGYLGGAAATQVIARSGIFPIAFSIGFGVLVWTGLILAELI
jgi:hypothetical protein